MRGGLVCEDTNDRKNALVFNRLARLTHAFACKEHCLKSLLIVLTFTQFMILLSFDCLFMDGRVIFV